MTDILLSVPPPFNMVVLIVLIAFGFGLLGTIAKQIRRFADNEADRRLKLEMMQSGMSAAEAREWAELKFRNNKKS